MPACTPRSPRLRMHCCAVCTQHARRPHVTCDAKLGTTDVRTRVPGISRVTMRAAGGARPDPPCVETSSTQQASTVREACAHCGTRCGMADQSLAQRHWAKSCTPQIPASGKANAGRGQPAGQHTSAAAEDRDSQISCRAHCRASSDWTGRHRSFGLRADGQADALTTWLVCFACLLAVRRTRRSQ